MQQDDEWLLWSHASIKVMDIRRMRLEPGERLRAYRLPANGFLYATRGKTRMRLDATERDIECFRMLHGSKGMLLDILPSQEQLEYYWLFYKAMFPMPRNRDLQRLLECGGPFRSPYSFAPLHPVWLYEQVVRMEEEWRRPEPLKNLRVKGLFYQFIHEVLRQMQTEGVQLKKPDLVDQTVRFLHEHYADAITLEGLAERFDCSPRQLSRLFKNRTGSSLIDYLIGLRMNKAKQLLIHTEATMQEIASDIGYPDGYYFSRMFKRAIGLSPIEFKTQARQGRLRPDLTLPLAGYDIVPDDIPSYINGNENHYRYKGEGEVRMYRRSNISVAAVLLLGMTLMLAACGGGGTNQTAENGGAPAPTNQITGQQGTETQSATRIYVNPDGKEVVIPTHPSRIVSNYFFGEMIALGVKPIGVGDSYYATQYPLVKNYTDGIADLGAPANFEKVTEAEPDLIVLNSDNNYEQWSRIAPAIVVKEGQPRENIRAFGEILGKQREAEAWLADFDAKVKEARQQIAGVIGPDETATVIRIRPNVQRVYGKWLGADILYDEFQLKPTPLVQQVRETDAGFADISLEVIGDYAGDYIFLAIDPGAEDAARSITESALWKSIPAVQNNRVYPIDQETFLFQDPLSVMQQVDLLVNLITSIKK